MKKYISILLLIITSFSISRQASSFTLIRVILACDNNPMYIQFWPIVSRAWTQLVGVRPTLALIADSSVTVDESLGDVIRFDPIPGVPTSLYAQAIRLLLPALYENDFCIIADIDMIPLSKEYFQDSVKDISDDKFVVYRDKGYPVEYKKFPMCYHAARGSVYKEVFNVHDKNSIPEIIKQWHGFNLGWNTDELVLYWYLTHWKDFETRCTKLGHGVDGRIDRSAWGYDKQQLVSKKYIDAHCLRPYMKYKLYIDQLVHDVGINMNTSNTSNIPQ